MSRTATAQMLGRVRAALRGRRIWSLLAGIVGVYLVVSLLQFLAGHRSPMDLLLAFAVGTVTLVATFDAHGSATTAERQRDESETFARILSALSRSVSPDAIVDAIVEELGNATRADHVAVVRLRSDGSALEATLVSMRPGTPASNTELPARLLDPTQPYQGSHHRRARPEEAGAPHASVRGPAHAGSAAGAAASGWTAAEIAERVAYRLRLDYGLHNTIAAPLSIDERLIGAIVLSRRTDERWPHASARLLENAASETSAALSRVYSHHAAEIEARTDQLTRLPNRRYFEEWCSLVAERRRATDHLAILAIDVDHFKLVNDRHGHQAGDEVLRAIGAAIQASVRDDDVPARYGGEEFVVLLRNPAPGIPYEIGERIRLAVRDLDLSATGVAGVTVSVGVAAAGQREPIASVIERADRALYAAKAAGRDRVVESIAELPAR